MNKKYIIILLVTITLIGGFLRIFPVQYDSVRMYDHQLVVEALDLGEGIARGDFSVFKTPVKYPYFFPYILLFFYGNFYLFGKLIGLFSSASQFINYIFFHLDGFYNFARILIGILGTALIPLIYIVTSKVVSFINKRKARIAGLLASFLMAFNLLHIHFSHQERPHILVSFFIFLSFYFFVLFLKKKSFINSLLLGSSIGLAAGSLHTGLIVALPFFLLIIIFGKFKHFLLAALAFGMIFVFCYPYLILSFSQTIHSSTGGFDFTLSGEKHVVGKGLSRFSGQGFGLILSGLFFYDLSLVLIFLLLLLIYLFYKKNQVETKKESSIFSQAVIGGIFFLALYVFIFGMYNATYFRFLLPLSPFLCFFAGVLFSEISYKLEKRFLRKVFIGILVLFLLFPLIQALRFNCLMFKKETRNLTKDWIENNISKSELIAIEHDDIRFIPDKKSLQSQSILEPSSLSRKDRFLLSLSGELYPENSRSTLNYWVFEHREDGYQFLIDQGVKYFVVSRPTFKELSRSGLEPEIISGGGELIKKFSPFIKEDSLRYSIFPAEFKNPILDLWTLERMGPIIEIYKIQL